jgi:hypothetical protein
MSAIDLRLCKVGPTALAHPQSILGRINHELILHAISV